MTDGGVRRSERPRFDGALELRPGRRRGALQTVPRVATVPEVRSELVAGLESHPYLERACAALDAGIPVVEPDQRTTTRETALLETLDPGEAQALAETRDGVIVTDDGDARDVARTRDVRLTGSIGLLVRFVESGQLTPSSADEHLKRWIDEAGFRAPSRDIETYLE